MECSDFFRTNSESVSYFTVKDWPLSRGPNFKRNGTAFLAHCCGDSKLEAEGPKQLCNMSVLMMPGFTGTAAIPPGNSWAKAFVSPSIAHLVAQYGATSASVDRPQPELKLTMTPLPRAIIAGTKCRITLTTPSRFTSTTAENSSAGTCHNGPFLLMIAALFSNRSGATC